MEELRPLLFSIAYRMLGSVAEAEDVVQDAYLRFSAVDLTQIVDASPYLSTTVARLCLDRLRSARARREAYVGTWLPEPLVDDAQAAPDRALELADDLTFALMLTLERLSPLERTAFLLHDVFGMDFQGVAEVLERTPATCRKLAERGRTQVRQDRPRFTPQPAEESRLLSAFLAASASGDVGAIAKLLASDAVLYTDGGGKRQAALNPIFGADRIARFFTGVPRKSTNVMPSAIEPHRINQLPGFVLRYDDGDVAVAACEIADGVITRIYIVRNPDKLRHLTRA
jgi:RNA polymerase sigma-70 factor, ECF subfamily